MNDVIEMLERRASTRAFSDEPITDEQREAIIRAAYRAPTAGNLMLYSIIEVTDQALKDRLAVTCDDQPFIATAPLVLVFVADQQRWMDMFDRSGAFSMDVARHRPWSGEGDLMLAACDALIAAQNAVVAAESLGIGSCYIGDILEQGETHAELLDLPRYTMPVTMLVFGHPRSRPAPRPRVASGVLHENRYHRPTAQELDALTAELDATFSPHGFKPGVADTPQAIYARKHASDFSFEMQRSVRWWFDRWTGGTDRSDR